MQSPESSIRVHLMVVDGGSHEEEGGIGSIHALRHFLVEILNNSIPARKK